MSKRSAASADFDETTTTSSPIVTKEHRQEEEVKTEVKTADPIQHWLASVTETMTLVKNLQFQKIKFPPLPERQAVTDYLNALRLTDEQVLKYEELCRQACEHLRSRVDKTHPHFDKTHPHFDFYNCYYRGKTTLGCKKDTQFGEAYKNTANIWPWLVERATDMLWDGHDDVLAFIFYTLFKVCGVSAVAHIALWERVLVSNSTYKIYNVWAPQVAVSQVFFSTIFDVEFHYDEVNYIPQVYTYVASVVTHNTSPKSKVDISFANCSVSGDVFTYNDDAMTRPVQANEIIFEGLVKEIKTKLK